MLYEVITENMAVLNAANVRILHCDGTHLSIEDASADVVISNGVFNLAPDKEQLFAEIFRILKPGGRLQFADIILVSRITSYNVCYTKLLRAGGEHAILEIVMATHADMTTASRVSRSCDM